MLFSLKVKKNLNTRHMQILNVEQVQVFEDISE